MHGTPQYVHAVSDDVESLLYVKQKIKVKEKRCMSHTIRTELTH